MGAAVRLVQPAGAPSRRAAESASHELVRHNVSSLLDPRRPLLPESIGEKKATGVLSPPPP